MARYCYDYVDNSAAEKLKTYTQRKHELTGSLDFTTVLNGIVLPGSLTGCLGGVVDSENNFIGVSSWHEGNGGGTHFLTLSNLKIK